MVQIHDGRMTHQYDGALGVFLIGIRFNRLHRPDQWVPVFTAMPKMLGELYRNRAAAARGRQPDGCWPDGCQPDGGWSGRAAPARWSRADLRAPAPVREQAPDQDRARP